MRYHVIGDEDTVLGFRFAGIRGEIARDADAARKALREVCQRTDVGIVIITDVVADLIREEVNEIRFGLALPLVVEVPGPGGPSPKRSNLLDLIREAVGVKV